MVVRELSLYPLLWHLLIPGFSSACVPIECLKCSDTRGPQPDLCPFCPNNNSQCIDYPMSSENAAKCQKDFQVKLNSTGFNLEESEDITLKCVHDLPFLTLTFKWYKDDQMIEGQNSSELTLTAVLNPQQGQYHCTVESRCGIYKSEPQEVTVNNNSSLLLIICGVSALVVVVIMGLAMKFKMKRDNEKHKARMEQRRMEEQRAPAQVTHMET